MQDHVNIKTEGRLQIFSLAENGRKTILGTTHNDFQKLGCGAVASCLYGPGACINKMYLMYHASAAQSITGMFTGGVTLARVQLSTGDYGYFRVPVIRSGVESSDASLGDNVITFTGISGGTPTGTSLENGNYL